MVTPTGTRCVWDEQGSKGCMTVVPMSGYAGIDPHFVAAAAGIIEKSRQAGMITALAIAAGAANTAGQFAVVPTDIGPGPAGVPSGSSTTTTLLPPSAVLPADPNAGDSDAWGSAFRLNGTRVTTPVIAGIVIGVVAALGIAAVVARQVVKRRNASQAAMSMAAGVTPIAAGLRNSGAADEPPAVQHNRHSLLGWLQRAVQNVPPPTPSTPSPAFVRS